MCLAELVLEVGLSIKVEAVITRVTYYGIVVLNNKQALNDNEFSAKVILWLTCITYNIGLSAVVLISSFHIGVLCKSIAFSSDNGKIQIAID